MTVSSTLTLSGLSPLKLPGSALQLALLTVDDQRCPTDVQCVWAGMATVTIQVSQPGAAPVQLRLYSGTPPGQAMPEQRWAFGRAFTVDTLLPRPLSTRTVAPADWRVTLSVRAEDMPR
jgi:hypothetical protein